MKKIRCAKLVLVLVLIFASLMQIFVSATEATDSSDEVDTSGYTVSQSGNVNTNVKWYLYTNGLLEVTGSGAIPSYSSGGAPWYSFRSSITSILVRDTVTSIGKFAFEGCTNLTSITLPFVGESRTATGSSLYIPRKG